MNKLFLQLRCQYCCPYFSSQKDKYPLQISSLNSDIDLYVQSENGSHTSLTKVEYIDSLNGIIRFVIDRDF